MAASARIDPILIACLVDSSAELLYQWNQILQAYISPLLQRIAAIHTNARNNRISQEMIRIGFVSYSDRYAHSNPILARRFFAPVNLITRELKDEPTSLGLGLAVPRKDAGMAVLEGYVAILEMFDAVPQIMEAFEHEPTLYLLHIAAVQPDNTSKPIWNQNHHLDDVTWSSLPAEILKRKIRHNMILTNPILQLQEFYKNIYRNPETHGIAAFKPTHKLLFSSLPSDVKTVPQKRSASDNLDMKPSQMSSPKAGHTGTSDVQVVINKDESLQQTQPSSATQSQQQQNNQRPTLDVNRLRAFFYGIENEIQNAIAALEQAKLSGKSKPELDAIENGLNLKKQQRTKAMQFYQMICQKSQAATINVATQFANSNTQTAKHLHPTTASSGQPSMLTPTRPGMNVQMEKLIAERMRPPVVAAAPTGVPPQLQPQQQSQLHTESQLQPLLQSQQSQLQPQQSQLQTPSQAHPQPHLHPPPQSQSHPEFSSQLSHQFQPQPQSQSGAANHAPGHVTSQPAAHIDTLADKPTLANFPKRWQGSFTWLVNSREVTVRVALYTQDNTLRLESWPNMVRFVQGHASISSSQVQIWLKDNSAVMSLVTHAPLQGNDEASMHNYKVFKLVRDLCQNKLLYSQFDMSEAPKGSGALLFPLQGPSPAISNETFVCVIFNKTPLPVEIIKPLSIAPNQAVLSQNQGTATSTQPNPSTVMHSMSNVTSDALQQQKMLALAQQANMQRNTIQNVAGMSVTPFGGINNPNANQLLQVGQQQSTNVGEQNVVNGSGVKSQVQLPVYRQGTSGTTSLTSAQMAQLLQYGLSGSADAPGQ